MIAVALCSHCNRIVAFLLKFCCDFSKSRLLLIFVLQIIVDLPLSSNFIVWIIEVPKTALIIIFLYKKVPRPVLNRNSLLYSSSLGYISVLSRSLPVMISPFHFRPGREWKGLETTSPYSHNTAIEFNDATTTFGPGPSPKFMTYFNFTQNHLKVV
jgi:hypothetical protein